MLVVGLLLWAAIGLEAVRADTVKTIVPGCDVLGGPAARELACRAAGIEALDRLPDLANVTRIDLTSNNLTNIPARGFRRYPYLEILLLRRNRIERIDVEAFNNMTRLALLELDDNNLTEFPRALARMSSLEELSLSNNRIRVIEADSLRDTRNLLSLDLRGNPIREVQPAAFQHLSRLRKLTLSNLKELSEFPSLEGCRSLEFLRLDRARIERVPDELCRHAPKLKSLDLKSNRLTAVPNLKDCRDLRVLYRLGDQLDILAGGQAVRGPGRVARPAHPEQPAGERPAGRLHRPDEAASLRLGEQLHRLCPPRRLRADKAARRPEPGE